MRVLETARIKYSKYPIVLGVAVGIKYRKRQATDEVGIVFFVEKKEDMPLKKLPRYLYGRFANGRVNLRKRIKTDVIQVGRVEFACGAGSEVSPIGGDSGTITLFFRNKAISDPTSYYILTCSHVVGNMEDSPPVGEYRNLRSPCCAGIYPFAETVKNSVIEQDRMPYDIALAEVTDKGLAHLGPANLPQLDGSVIGTGRVLKEILPNVRIELYDEVECAVARTGGGHFTANISMLATDFPVKLEGREVWVSDLYTIELDVEGGDSGGLVYRDRAAIGMIIARSPEGWAWFHPLDNALNYLGKLNPPRQLKIF